MFGLGDRVLAMVGGGVAAVLAIALAFTTISKNATIAQLEKDKRDLTSNLNFVRDDLKACRINGLTLQSSIDKQNAALADAKAAGVMRAAELSKSLALAKAEAATARTRADRLLAAKGTGDACKDADALILGELP